MFESCLRNYECSEQLAKQEVTSIFRALNRNGSDTSSDTYLYNHIGWQEPNNVKKCTLKPKISYLQEK